MLWGLNLLFTSFSTNCSYYLIWIVYINSIWLLSSYEQMRWSKFFYMTTVPSHKDLQWPQVEPTPEDFTASMRRHVDPTLNKEPPERKSVHSAWWVCDPESSEFQSKQPQESWAQRWDSGQPKGCSGNSMGPCKQPSKTLWTVRWHGQVSPVLLMQSIFVD